MKKLFLFISVLFSLFVCSGVVSAWGPPELPYVIQESAPAITDDNYTVPYMWVDVSSDLYYLLIDNTTGAAAWEQLQTSGTSYGEVVTVAKSGGNYSTIQAAIDSITDNATDKRYAIFIYPGTYSENVVMEEYVSLIGMGDHVATDITASTGVTVTCPPNTSAVNITNLSIENTGDGGTALKHTTSFAILNNVYLSWVNSDNGASGTLIDLDGGVFSMYGGKLRYNGGGDSVGAVTHTAVDITGTARPKFFTVSGDLDIEDVDDILYGFNYDASFTGNATHYGGEYAMDALDAAYSGTMGFIRCLGLAESMIYEFLNIDIVSAGNGTGVCFTLDSPAGSGSIKAFSNHIHVEDFATNYGANIATGDTIIATNMAVTAADGFTGSGTLTRNGTVLNADYYMDGDVHATYIEFPDAANSYIGADKTYTNYFAFANDYTNFWLGYSGDPNIWINYEQDADIIVGAGTGGDTDIFIQEGDINKTTLNQEGSDFKIQVGTTNGDIVLEPNGTGGVGIGTTAPQGDIQISSEDTHGGYVQKIFSASSGTLTGATDTIELNIPAGWIIRGCQLHVKTAVTNAGDDTWSSELNDGAQEEVISAGSAAAQNTNVNHFGHADAGYGGTLTDAETDILLTPQGADFTAGEIEAHCICFGFDSWTNE